jgi:hypothetical protein
LPPAARAGRFSQLLYREVDLVKLADLAKRYLSVESFAAEIGRSARTVRHWCARGRLPEAFCLGRAGWFIPLEYVEGVRAGAYPTAHENEKTLRLA